ncbi:MAG: S8 family serine peptidase [Candidatus Krumholzibacteriota bacterium]|nr:S8 family serine peptidase [Candidatus Krumholzibacteriota bacterium]
MGRALACLLLGAALAGPLAAQQMPPPPAPAMPRDLPMEFVHFDAERLALSQDWAPGALRAELAQRGIVLSEDGLAHVTIAGPEGAVAVPARLVTSVGGRDDVAWRRWRDAWVPVTRLTELARSLPAGHFLGRVQAPWPADVQGEGTAAINSDGYRDGGADGTGLTVAIIDGGYDGLTEAWENGDIPSPYTWINYTPHPLESQGDHGTACVEQVYDHAPGADYRLYMIDSATDLGLAVADAAAAGVDVISMSVVWPIAGWEDDAGAPCAAVNEAAANGMLVFISAGNFAECHWQGDYDPGGDSSAWHDFQYGDEAIDVVVADGAEAAFTMQWNTVGDIYNYDLYLLDASQAVLASSTNPDNHFESLSWPNETGADQTAYLCVHRVSGGITEFEIFSGGCAWQQHAMAWSSVASPGNATAPNVFAVGAVPWGDYGSPNGTDGILAGYSSQGPSNGGMTLPDLCAPTAVTCFTAPWGMGGTSCSAPCAAGAAAAFWSADPGLHVDAVRWLILEQAGQWRDWGDWGNDNVYGRGGMILYEFAPHTVWVSRAYGNVADDPAYPLYTVQYAHYCAETGGRLLLFPGGVYPEAVNLSRELTVETTGPEAVLGE